MVNPTDELGELRDEIQRLTTRITELEALHAVRETLLNYTLCHDRGHSNELAALFTEDAKLDISGFGENLDTSLSGREAIRQMYQQIDGRSGGPPPHKHAIANLRIAIDGDEATAHSYLLDWGGAPTEHGPGGSMYHERLQRQPDGRWLIKHKRIVCTAELTVDAVLSFTI